VLLPANRQPKIYVVDMDDKTTSGGDAKWTCVRCTYENYATTTKCTLCRRVRRIEDELVSVGLGGGPSVIAVSRRRRRRSPRSSS